MKIAKLLLAILVILALGFATNKALNYSENDERVDTRIDNQGYWRRLASKGIVPYNPEITVEPAVFSGSRIRANTVSTQDSPDVPVTEINCLQSENSVFINPLDETNILNSNNSATNPFDTAYGANSFFSTNSGAIWEGEVEGAGEDNFGDPAAVFGLNGRWYINYINSNFRMGVSFSDDMGESWTVKDASPHPDISCDKNHMWIDNNPDSPYEGNVYVAWTNFSDLDLGQIGFSYSVDNGETWVLNSDISSDVAAGSHNQGVNLSTGPDGELYAVWAIYDTWLSGGSDETAIGMSRSLDGGITWEPAKRIITEIKGIRASQTTKDMRVNSFPVATVDNSNSADRGTIYVTWANNGVPGINNGYDVDVYIIKSIDQGETWSDHIKVNQSILGQGKQHYLPWITCDPTTGILSMVYYDDRNVDYNQCEVFCANSVDGGLTWEEFKVSDVSFTPAPIPGLADSYMGDYLGIHAKNGVVYPIWTDNRLGYAMSYCSPYETNPVNRPINLEGEVIFETGEAQLNWDYENAPGFLAFIIYRDGDSVATTTDTSFSEILPAYGSYRYRVTAHYNDNIESGASGISLQWGSVTINVSIDSIKDHLPIGFESLHPIIISNTGQLDLEYSLGLVSSQSKNPDYCSASGGGGAGNEYISGVEIGEIINLNTGSNNYTDYADLATTMKVGSAYDIHVTNGHPFNLDQCGVWIDWNIDGEFDEEELIILNGQTLSPDYYGTIIPPPGSVTGTTKMRVRLTYSGALNPCGNTTFGEVEDYTINLHGWMDLTPMNATVMPGDTSLVTVSFNTIDLPPGDYSTNLIVTSNDSDNESIQIPISLRVDHLFVEASVNHNVVCPKSLIRLQASVEGLFDSIQYSWTSSPVGFISEKPRPYAIPQTSTWYYIMIQDGDHIAFDSVFVETLPVAEVNFGPDTAVCGSSTVTLDAGNDGISYLWSTGDTTNVINVDSTGVGFGSKDITVEITNSLDCTAIYEIQIEFINCSGIHSETEATFNIYPNPNKGIFYIDFVKAYNKSFDIYIINSSGIVLYHQQGVIHSINNPYQVSVENLVAGTYIVIIESGKSRYQQRLIISN